MQDESVVAFYDDLAADFHLIFADWWASVLRQGEAIGALLRSLGVEAPARILDCSCGIGTQALGLAYHGFTVTGTDVSERAVARAREEAAARRLDVGFSVADMRSIHEVLEHPVDAVVSCDNSLPHLLTDEDLGRALRSIRRCLHAGGPFLASLRDYDRLAVERPAGELPRLFETRSGRRIVGQAWEWEPGGGSLRINLFILEERGGPWTCSVRTTRYRVLRRNELTAALYQAGFTDVTWHAPEATGYFQPIVTARAG